jgi:hypothetical protein
MGKKISVKNRSAGSVVYRVPDLKVRRDFRPGEIKTVDIDELRQLSYTQGGAILLAHYLQILDKPSRDEVTGPVEPEYNYSDEDVKKLILTGSLDSFLDALDFAPVGVIDMIKDYAVSLPMSDLNKMQALKDKTGFDVQMAIANNKADEAPEAPPTKKRRVAVTEEGEEAPKKKRRTTKKETPEA